MKGEFDPKAKHISTAFGRAVYFIGQDSEGINYWLEAASWDCDWYWGFGYIEAYTHNTRPALAKDIISHEHFDTLNRDEHINYFDAFKNRFVVTPLSDGEIWKLCDLMRCFYIAREYADMLYCGGAHYASNPCCDIIQSDNNGERTRINDVLLPGVFKEVYKLLTPTDIEEVKDSSLSNPKTMNGIDITIHGKTYNEHKECARKIAHEYQELYGAGEDLSWAEIVDWSSLLGTFGKRYGLSKEFIENGVL